MPAPQSISVNDLSVEQTDLIHKIWTDVFFSVPGTVKKVLLQAAKTSELHPTNISTTNVTEVRGKSCDGKCPSLP